MTMRQRLIVAGLVYALHLAIAAVVGIVAASLASQLVGGFDAGDRLLFEPGALFASEALRLWRGPLTALARAGSGLTLAVAYAGLVPLAAALVALGSSARVTLADAVRQGSRRFGALSLLLGATLVVQTLAGLLFAAIGLGVRGAMASHGNDRTIDLTVAAIWTIGAALVVGIGIVQDLARIHIVCRGSKVLSAALAAGDAFLGAPVSLAMAWAKRAALAVLLVVVGAWMAGAIGTASGGRIVAIASIHQMIAFALVALRVSWLGAAIERTVHPDATLRAAGETPEASGPFS